MSQIATFGLANNLPIATRLRASQSTVFPAMFSQLKVFAVRMGQVKVDQLWSFGAKSGSVAHIRADGNSEENDLLTVSSFAPDISWIGKVL
jgi:hypothetical protein